MLKGLILGGALQAQNKRCLCLGTRYAKRRRRNKLGGEVICSYSHSTFVTGEGVGPKDFCLMA